MNATSPRSWIDFSQQQISHLQDDCDRFWKEDHEVLSKIRWPLEKLIERANQVYDLVDELNVGIQNSILDGEIPYSDEFDESTFGLYAGWLKLAEGMKRVVKKLVQIYGNVDGADLFFANLERCRAIVENNGLSEEISDANVMANLAKGNPNPDRYGL